MLKSLLRETAPRPSGNRHHDIPWPRRGVARAKRLDDRRQAGKLVFGRLPFEEKRFSGKPWINLLRRATCHALPRILRASRSLLALRAFRIARSLRAGRSLCLLRETLRHAQRFAERDGLRDAERPIEREHVDAPSHAVELLEALRARVVGVDVRRLIGVSAHDDLRASAQAQAHLLRAGKILEVIAQHVVVTLRKRPARLA